MPIIDTSKGAIESVLLVDETPDENSFVLIQQLLQNTSAVIYYISDSNAPSTIQSMGDRVKKLSIKWPNLYNSGVSKDIKLILNNKPIILQNSFYSSVTDEIMAVMPMATSKKKLMLDGDTFSGVKHGIDTFLQDFELEYVDNDKRRFFLKGGDCIVSDQFIIIGPQTSYYNPEMNLPGYWPDFLQFYNYSGLSPRILQLERVRAFGRCWNNIFYHLDFYLTYLGYKEGKPFFLLGEVSENTTGRCNADSVALNAVCFLEYTKTQLTEFFNGHVIIERIPIYIHESKFPFTYNSALIEALPGHNKYFMPKYVFDKITDTASINAIEAVRDECKGKIEQLFGEVKLIDIPDSYIFSQEGRQSLHCLVAVLNRV